MRHAAGATVWAALYSDTRAAPEPEVKDDTRSRDLCGTEGDAQ